MTTLAVPISDEDLDRLRELAEREGVEPGEYLRRRVGELLDADAAFRSAAARVLRKNAELYRRLA